MLKGNKIKLLIKQHLSLYYIPFFLMIKIFIIFSTIVFLFTNFCQDKKNKIYSILLDFTSSTGFLLQNVIIEGQTHLTEDDIIESIGTDRRVSIYSLDIDVIRKNIEKNQSIKVVLVERRLPNTLFISIKERKPIAIWQFEQSLYLVDEAGVRITSKNIEKFTNLTRVVGKDANIYADELIKILVRHPSLNQRIISASHCFICRRWDLRLDQQIIVRMPGNKDFFKAYDYLYALDKGNKLFNQKYKIINLEDSKRYYVEK